MNEILDKIVKKLQRQIQALLFERTGISVNKAKLLQQVHPKSENPRIGITFRNPYFFEFLELKISENDLETALLNYWQEFIFQLGEKYLLTNIFCILTTKKILNNL